MNILLFSNLNVGKNVSGPSIRYMEFSKQLCEHHNVTLVAPKVDKDFMMENINIKKYSLISFIKLLIMSDIVIWQPTKIFAMFLAKLLNKKMVVDLYDPILLEYLEMYKGSKGIKTKLRMKYGKSKLKFALCFGDIFICASKKQRSYYHGCLSLMGRINERTYKEDYELNKLIIEIPYGLQETRFEELNFNFSQFFKEINPEDKVLIWGGGIWNWFDPITLIRALNEVVKDEKNVKLFFMGAGHPDSRVPKMKKYNEAVNLAKELGIINKYVFFNKDWVPYNERAKFLRASHIGISTHYNTIETEYSFRTRILDYLWTDLPIITTQGDFFARYVKEKKLGITVEAENVNSLKNAILELVRNNVLYNEMKKNISENKEEFVWSEVTKPLINYCSAPYNASDSKNKFHLVVSTIKNIFGLIF
jgi:glycosyltransferase involved in cell wall biosynthesis